MARGRYILYIIITILSISTATAAPRKVYKKTYHKNAAHMTKRQAFMIEDSLLNSPKDVATFTYSEKDIPDSYVRALDSTLHIYQRGNLLRTDLCEDDTLAAIELPDSVYMERLNQIPSLIELCFNDIVKDYIKLYTFRKRRLTSYILGLSDYYFPIFVDALESEGLPLELKNLAIIESALNPRACSPVGASGLWQFMASTGSMYGLRINSLVDERRDPVLSTRAAARYLKHLYSIYHDWTLVIAAYNCGPGNVNKAIRRAKGERDYWEIYEYLPRETRGYVPAFIAANYAMHYYKEHNICPREANINIAVDTLNITDRVHLKQIAAVLDIDIEELRNMNPQFRRDIIPGGSPYTLILPTNKLSQYEMYKNTILAYEVPGYNKNRTQVDPKKHYASATRPASQNKTHTSTPKKAPVASNKAEISAQNDKEEIIENYKVKEGDTLYGIAQRNKVTVVKIKQWNSLKSDNLRIGQTLVLKKEKK